MIASLCASRSLTDKSVAGARLDKPRYSGVDSFVSFALKLLSGAHLAHVLAHVRTGPSLLVETAGTRPYDASRAGKPACRPASTLSCRRPLCSLSQTLERRPLNMGVRHGVIHLAITTTVAPTSPCDFVGLKPSAKHCGTSENSQDGYVVFRPEDRVPESFSYEKPLETSFRFSLGQLHEMKISLSQRRRRASAGMTS